MADIYGFSSNVVTPATADKSSITWGEEVAGAVQVSIAYNQQINKRRQMGNGGALVWASQPTGQINIQKLVIGSLAKSKAGFNACDPVDIIFHTRACDTDGGDGTVTATGCVVSSYTITAETDGMTVMENVVIDFVSLS
jgi:hypothetical protein